EQLALASRPELREQDYQTRISAAETRKAMLRLLPGLEFSAGGHYDSNSFLVNQSWADYGVKVTWNLFNVLSAPAAIDVAKAGQQVADARRQAMSIDRKSTRLNSSHVKISYAVFCLKKKIA